MCAQLSEHIYGRDSVARTTYKPCNGSLKSASNTVCFLFQPPHTSISNLSRDNVRAYYMCEQQQKDYYSPPRVGVALLTGSSYSSSVADVCVRPDIVGFSALITTWSSREVWWASSTALGGLLVQRELMEFPVRVRAGVR
ncbi:hypothetical protein KIN20_020026 [Parelaphostrongylus tenuis]|uniref:Uncharacterized protein n=1 Tax=Parelaphostrongylus tenuis TaxID=148309 RepID=A0AAD5QSX5_PARTN|nr:hypothetical protein KIN20_020026 [Parelaphostrongylus tenuis]